MNPRERMLASILVVLLVGAGGCVVFMQLFWKPLEDYDQRIAAETEEVQNRRLRKKQILADQVRLQRYREFSLPGDPDLAKREYENYLTGLLIKSGFTAGNFNVTYRSTDTRSSPVLPGVAKKPVYTRLTYTADGTARLENIVRFLEGFYQTGLLHEIKNLQIQRSNTPNVQRPGQPATAQAGPNELAFNITVEALILTGADYRKSLSPNIESRFLAEDAVAAMRGGPTGLGSVFWAIGPTGPGGPEILARPGRNYEAIVAKDIFFGPPHETPKSHEEVDFTHFVRLTDITQNGEFQEAGLYNRLNDVLSRLRATPGRNRYRLMDDKGQLVVQAEVAKIGDRDIILHVDDKYYSMHVGQNLGDALRQPLNQEQVDALFKERVNAKLPEPGKEPLKVKD